MSLQNKSNPQQSDTERTNACQSASGRVFRDRNEGSNQGGTSHHGCFCQNCSGNLEKTATQDLGSLSLSADSPLQLNSHAALGLTRQRPESSGGSAGTCPAPLLPPLLRGPAILSRHLYCICQRKKASRPMAGSNNEHIPGQATWTETFQRHAHPLGEDTHTPRTLGIVVRTSLGTEHSAVHRSGVSFGSDENLLEVDDGCTTL